MTARPAPHRREDYRHERLITTRWMDNDAYAHVNNVVYYSWFDTVVNAWLIERGLLDIERSPCFGLVVETGCQYFSPIAFPDPVGGALRVRSLGRTSVRYEVALFRGDDTLASAQGHFVHVHVDRATRRPVELPPPLRQALEEILAPA